MSSKIELKTDREILIAMDEKLNSISNSLENTTIQARSGDGFTRCVKKDKRISSLEDWQKNIRKVVLGITITVGAALLIFTAKFIVDNITAAEACLF